MLSNFYGKKEIMNLIRKLPEDATIDEIMYVKKKILYGIKELYQGKVIPHEQAMDNAKKRLDNLNTNFR